MAAAAQGGVDGLPLAAADVPGAYAWPHREHGQLLLSRHMQALDALRHQHHAAGTVRTLAPAIPTLQRPDLVLSAPGGLHLATPAHALWAAGRTLSLTAGQDLTCTTTGDHSLAARSGLAWFTYGKATGGEKPNQETGIALHAASGKVVTQSQSAATHLTAQQRVSLSSTQADIHASAPEHIQLAAGGSALRIEGGNITMTTPGPARFRAAMRELAGGESVSAPWWAGKLRAPALEAATSLAQFRFVDDDGHPMAGHKYVLIKEDGSMEEGVTDDEGRTQETTSAAPQRCFARLIGEGE